MVYGDFNAYLTDPKGTTHAEGIAEALAAAGLEDMSANFLPSRKPWFGGGCTWRMRHGSRVLHDALPISTYSARTPEHCTLDRKSVV